MTQEEAIEYGTEWLKDEYLDAKDREFIKTALEALEREQKESEYKRAFKVACELLNDDYLYGYDRDRIFAEVMQAEGVFSSEDYEQFILEHLDRLSGEERER